MNRKHWAILTVLRDEGPQFGPILRKKVDQWVVLFYHRTGALEDAGLITHKVVGETEEHPYPRVFFEITTKGRKKLIEITATIVVPRQPLPAL